MNADDDPKTQVTADQPAPAAELRAGDGAPVERPPMPPKETDQPPARKPVEWTAERVVAERTRLDAALVVLVLVIAVLLGSFPAANSDLWRQLATGRLVAAGGYTFGVDPFAATTSGVRWVDHSWLFDLKLFELANILGGPESALAGFALVFVKSLMVAFLAWVLMSIRRPEQGWWAPAATVLLALLAMTPQLQLGPALVSFLFLSFTLYFLTRPDPETPSTKLVGKLLESTPFCLFVLFAMWVNMDRWFVLGPLTVALCWLGESIQNTVAPIRTGRDARGPERSRGLLLALAAGLAGCLLNPHHVFAFALPRELALYFTGGPVMEDPYLARLTYSSLKADYLRNPALGWNVAAMCYLPLVLLGALSFVLARAELRWWRVVLWAFFLVLSVLLAVTVPFFAIVAAPITALNLQDYAAARFGTAPSISSEDRRRALGGRFATALVMTIVLAGVALGWTGMRPAGQRLGWTLSADPSMVRGALKLNELRRQGVLTEGGFNYTPAFADYAAWFAPGERSFFDDRVTPFTPEAQAEYLQVRDELRKQLYDSTGRPITIDAGKLERVFAAKGRPLDHLVVCFAPGSRPDPEETLRVAHRLWLEPERWTMLALEGHVAIFGYHDPKQPGQAKKFRAQRFDAEARAFAPQPAAEAPVPFAATEARPAGSDEAMLLVAYCETMQVLHSERYRQVRQVVFHVDLAFLDLVGLQGTLPPAPGANLALAFRAAVLAAQPLRTPAYPIPGGAMLAVRAARRGLDAAPERGDAHLALASALLKLRESQRRRVGNAMLLEQIRRVQIVTALTRAARLDPSPSTHHLLAGFYGEMRLVDPRLGDRPTHIDLYVEHRRKGHELERVAGPRPFETRDTFDKRLEQQEKSLQQMEQQLKKRHTDFDLESAGKPLGQRFGIAMQLGLSQTALELLLNDPDAVRKDPSAYRELLLMMLNCGRVDEVKGDPQQANVFPDPFIHVLVAAADGEYEVADEYLAGMIRDERKQRSQALLMGARDVAFQGLVDPLRLQAMAQVMRLTGQQADLRTLRGLLTLEKGDNREGGKQIRHALELTLPVELLEDIVSCVAAPDCFLKTANLLYMPRRGPSYQFEYLPLADYYEQLLLEAERD